MPTTTPRAALPELAAAQAQKHVTHNEALIQLDALLNARILDRDLSAPPGSPVDGDAYLVKAAGSGAWAGQDGKIAFAADGGWRFYAPFAGLAAYIADESVMLVYTAGGWVDWASIVNLQNVPLVGVNTAADATNKFALKSNAALFAALEAANGGTGDMQVKLDKETAADTGSILFQTSFSGRAEFGLIGDDNFHIKVSPDNVTWRDAIIVDKTTGFVGIGIPVPSAILEVSGGRFQVTNDELRSVTTGSGVDVRLGADTFGINQGAVGTVSNHPFDFYAFSTRVVRITPSGNVGIGTAAPAVTLDVNGPVAVKSYTVAAVPPASAGAGQIVYVSNESGGAVLAFSDGTAWRRVTDRAVIS